MPTPVFTLFNQFKEDLFAGVHDVESDVLKWFLTNSAVTTAGTVKADYTDLSTGNGYTAGGATWASVSAQQTSGTLYLMGDDVSWAATGSVGPFRYAVLYNDTPTSPADPLIGFLDLGYAITLANGQTMPLEFNPTLGIWYF